MGKEIVLKSQRYLDKRTTVSQNWNCKVERVTVPVIGSILGIACGAIPAMITGHADFYAICAMTVPAALIFLLILHRQVHGKFLQYRIQRLCKKVGVNLTPDDKDMISSQIKYRNLINLTLSFMGTNLFVSKNNNNGIETVKITKSPETEFKYAFSDAVLLTDHAIHGDAREEKIVVKDNLTDFEKSIHEKVDEVNKIVESCVNNKKFSWNVGNNQNINFFNPEAVEGFKDIENMYLKDLNDRLSKEL